MFSAILFAVFSTTPATASGVADVELGVDAGSLSPIGVHASLALPEAHLVAEAGAGTQPVMAWSTYVRAGFTFKAGSDAARPLRIEPMVGYRQLTWMTLAQPMCVFDVCSNEEAPVDGHFATATVAVDKTVLGKRDLALSVRATSGLAYDFATLDLEPELALGVGVRF